MYSGVGRRPVMRHHHRLRTGKTLPPAYWKPYPWASIHKPIVGTEDGSAGSPSVHADSSAIVSKLTTPGNPSQMLPGQDSNSAGTNLPVTHPVYFADHTDPLFTVSQRTGGNASTWWGTQIRIPQDALPAAGVDAHLASIQPNGDEYFIYDVASNTGGTVLTELPAGGGTIYGTGFAKHRFDGDGAPISTGDATAAKWPSMYGPIRVEEMYARVINHALFMTANWSNGLFVDPAHKTGRFRSTTLTGSHTFPVSTVTVGSTSGFTSTGTFRLPNSSLVTYTGLTGTTFTGCTGGTGTHGGGSAVVEHYWPPVGARFQLNMSQSSIDAISDSSNSTGRWWNKVLLTAMRKYGLFVGDTGGGNWSIHILAGTSQWSLTGVDPWRTWASSTSPAMSYNATDDVYLWDYRTVVSYASNLRVLDWDDPDNH